MDDAQKELIQVFENDERFEYFRFIATNFLLAYDEYGIPCGWGSAIPIFLELETKTPKTFPIPKEKFDGNRVIQGSLTAIGIEPEKMWPAIRLIRLMSEAKFVDTLLLTPSIEMLERKLLAALSDENPILKIERSGKRVATFSEKQLLDHLRSLLENDIKTNSGDPGFSGQSFDNKNPITLGTHKQMYYEYQRYMENFTKYCTDQNLPPRTKGPSRDKVLLISRLLYLTGLTDNKSFWDGKESLKGIIRKCQNVSAPDTLSLRYLL